MGHNDDSMTVAKSKTAKEFVFAELKLRYLNE